MVQPQELHKPPLRTVLETHVAVTAATYTAKAGDRFIGVNRAGTVTITLPTSQLRAGRLYTIKDESGAAATNNITVATEGAETIDGSATDTINQDYGAKAYYSDGSNWFTVPLLSVAPHTLASHSAKAHSDLSGVGTGDHHAQSHTLDSHTGTLQHEKGGLEADVSAGDGFVEVKGGSTTVIKSNTGATAGPGVTDDTNAGYAVGSVWIDTTNDKAYVCLDASAGAAVWSEVTLAGGAPIKEFFVSYASADVFNAGVSYPAGHMDADGEDIWIMFMVPADFSSIIDAVIILRPGTTTAAADWDVTTHYAAAGENYSGTHTQSDTTSTYNITTNIFFELDISGLLTSLAVGDYVGVNIQRRTSGDAHVMGVRFKYS
ncbi:MAG: hypothetical protein IIC97_03290 [Chloroflexi bacterium]|nr:hypothetical protein [Chloroflexota bacterium]